ncbi:MAG: hypothetical protein ACYDHO_06545 [Gaiellaceae bacterium]
MKRTLAALLLLLTLMLPVSSAGAATPQAKQVKTLQKQVKTLQRQVKTLQTQVKIVNAVAGANWSATVCTLAMVADTFQATWTALGTAGISGFGAPFSSTMLTPLADYNACKDLDLTRQTGLATPSWTSYSQLINLLYGP